MTIAFRPATLDDVPALAPQIREIDAREIHAMDHTTEEGLRLSIADSRWAVVAEIDGRMLAVFGVADMTLLGGQGCPWLFTSELVERHPRRFFVASQAWLKAIQAEYWSLVVDCAAFHIRSIAWLKRLGLTVEPARPWGPRGELFHRVTWSRQ